jgi:flagellar protein FliO/FliZ
MDILSLLRMFGALGVVLGLLAGALWVVRRYELRLPQKWLSGFAASDKPRRLELVERLALDPRRSVALIRKDGREHMLLIAPEGLLILEAANAPKGGKVNA